MAFGLLPLFVLHGAFGYLQSKCGLEIRQEGFRRQPELGLSVAESGASLFLQDVTGASADSTSDAYAMSRDRGTYEKTLEP